MISNFPGAHGQSVDGESLQADVMRFMAIIAFCLIAILALVRNVEPAPAAPEQQAPPPLAEPPPPKQPVSRKPALSPALAQPRPLPVVEKVIRVRPAAQAATPVPGQLEAAKEVSKPVLPPTAPAQEPAPAPEPAASPERGLSLRFASDRDFLRLVTKGEIQVYAYQQGAEVLGLARNFEFNQAPAPGRLYELLPDTIPRLVASALQRATDDAAAFTWGIRLPPELEGRIRRYVDQDAVGELVIDRSGQVHHVAL